MDDTTTQIEIFRAGIHTALDGSTLTVTPADLAAIAADYDPTVGEAPLVIGHPQLNAPAYGWAKTLSAQNGVLFAAAGELDPAFRDAVKAGRYKKRSASFFRSDSPGNPKPGRMYLRHIGFLGAAVPAVTGLRDVSFAAADGATTIEFAANQPWWVLREIASLFRRQRDAIVAKEGVEAADALIPSYLIESINQAAQVAAEPVASSFATPEIVMPEPNQQTADFAARETQLTAREQTLAAREQAILAAERGAMRRGIMDFAATLVTAGRLLPAEQPAVIELLDQLESQTAQTPVSFAAADGAQVSKTPAAILRDLLNVLPVRTPLGEVGGGRDSQLSTANFAAPLGVAVDSERLRLHNQAIAYQRTHAGASYVDAVAAIGG